MGCCVVSTRRVAPPRRHRTARPVSVPASVSAPFAGGAPSRIGSRSFSPSMTIMAFGFSFASWSLITAGQSSVFVLRSRSGSGRRWREPRAPRRCPADRYRSRRGRSRASRPSNCRPRRWSRSAASPVCAAAAPWSNRRPAPGCAGRRKTEKRRNRAAAAVLIVAGSGRPIAPIIDLGGRGHGHGRSACRNRQRTDEPSPIPLRHEPYRPTNAIAKTVRLAYCGIKADARTELVRARN